MSKKDDTVKQRRELLFAYDVMDANPNGDPDDANRPRMDSEGYNVVTDVRLKRTIRDYWDTVLAGEKGCEVLVKRHIDPETADLKTMGGIVSDALEIDTKKLKDKKYKSSTMKKIINDIPAKFIDARCFGAAVTLADASYSHVGPVQFAIGHSLNKPSVNSYTITTTFASKEDRAAGTFGEFHVVDYSLLLFHGLVSEHTARDTGMTETDILRLFQGLWFGTKMLNTRSKFNHAPKFLISVVSKTEHFQIGGLDRLVSVDKVEGVKSIGDVVVDLTTLVDILKNNADHLDRIEYLSDDDMVTFGYQGKQYDKIADVLKETGVNLEAIEVG